MCTGKCLHACVHMDVGVCTHMPLLYYKSRSFQVMRKELMWPKAYVLVSLVQVIGTLPVSFCTFKPSIVLLLDVPISHG